MSREYDRSYTRGRVNAYTPSRQDASFRLRRGDGAGAVRQELVGRSPSRSSAPLVTTLTSAAPVALVGYTPCPLIHPAPNRIEDEGKQKKTKKKYPLVGTHLWRFSVKEEDASFTTRGKGGGGGSVAPAKELGPFYRPQAVAPSPPPTQPSPSTPPCSQPGRPHRGKDEESTERANLPRPISHSHDPCRVTGRTGWPRRAQQYTSAHRTTTHARTPACLAGAPPLSKCAVDRPETLPAILVASAERARSQPPCTTHS
ncbi:hypothetical protein HPB51_010739 [Rhipicephalus microplus]|uniref:Uncharacterized protein n=1 Tax=Rhipicephalus microplus TaxID=6941 RepID=A0A9J6DU04_RHIMP|nr:hypothetical protein HPB51_010739 [Rhipicephalus microplus]